jgi:hypothetical protein
MDIIGQTPCDSCRGEGYDPSGKICTTCGGSGLLPVAKSGKPLAVAERRRWPRLRFEVPVNIIVGQHPHPPRISGRGTALNPGGLTIHTDASLDVGQQLQLEFMLPHLDKPMRLHGTVRNRQGGSYGIEFATTAEEEALARFRNFLVGEPAVAQRNR